MQVRIQPVLDAFISPVALMEFRIQVKSAIVEMILASVVRVVPDFIVGLAVV